MVNSILIGLELEGVMLDRFNNVVRWKDIPHATATKIQGALRYCNGEQLPIDRYDCMAELRTYPVALEKGARGILYALSSLIIQYNSVFAKHGLTIDWSERAIPTNTHDEIILDLKANKIKKQIYTIKDGKIQPIILPQSKYRGGGLHINISGFDPVFFRGMLLDIHEALFNFNKKDTKSEYRNFNFRYTTYSGGVQGFEYMGLGLNLKQEYSLSDMLSTIHHQFHWADALIFVLERWANAIKKD